MSNWKNKIEMTFGISDLIFAGHPNDEQRAFELVEILRAEGIGWSALEKEARTFLQSKGANSAHIDKQIEKMKNSMAFWLLD
jgi:hypothetical protein